MGKTKIIDNGVPHRNVDGGPCKIGAAVVVLSEALSIMFSDDVAMVQAFDLIVEQLMTRKQRAEEVLWATLVDVLYRHTLEVYI
jgi:hypothetical protein